MSQYQVVIVEDLLQFPPVFEYWQRQIAHNLLKFRLPEIKNPAMEDVRGMIADKGNFCTVVWDNEDHVVAGEAMLNTFQGRNAMMHYSVNPAYRRERQTEMCRTALSQIFDFRLLGSDDTLLSISGLTPISNRLSINFLQKIGFSAIGTVNNSFVLANYGNRVVDGVLVQLNKSEIGEWAEQNRVHTTGKSRDIT